MNKKNNTAEIQNQTNGFDVEKIRKDFPILHQEINGKPVETIEEAISAIGSIKSNGSITINRSGRRIALRFRL